MKSALFLDFDNIYLCLRNIDSAAAQRFANRPDKWAEWLTGYVNALEQNPSAESRVAPPKRRFLLKRCYLNPATFSCFRMGFTRAGFEVVDCPSLTRHGKTSTDITMAIDCMDALHSPRAHIDEFLILSADSDFTPLLHKLRSHDRRAGILSVGAVSSAYTASASYTLSARTLLREGLGIELESLSAEAGLDAENTADSEGAVPATLAPVGK